MTRRLIPMIVLAALTLACGCAGRGSGPDPYVADHEYVSPTDPPLRIKFDPAYRYLGEATRTTEGEDGKKEVSVAHIFVQAHKSKEVDLIAAVIRVRRDTGWKFPPVLFKHCGQYASGILNIDNTYYQSRVVAVGAERHGYILDHIKSKGYEIPESILLMNNVKHVSDAEIFNLTFAAKVGNLDPLLDRRITPEEQKDFGKFVNTVFSTVRFKGKSSEPAVHAEYILPLCPNSQDDDQSPSEGDPTSLRISFVPRDS